MLPLDRWVPPVPSDLNQQRAAGGAQARAAIDKRNILASYVKGRLKATPAQYNQHAYAAVLHGPDLFNIDRRHCKQKYGSQMN